MMEGVPFAVEKTQLRSGDKLVIFSDGLSDAVSLAEETFEKPLRKFLRKAPRELSAAKLHEAIWRELREFTGGRPQLDDITVLVAEYRR
jgi:sigma-B regulation protein RsbU (phosphoserine phosphatase)